MVSLSYMLLGGRILLVLLLYLFIFMLVRTLRRDLRSATRLGRSISTSAGAKTDRQAFLENGQTLLEVVAPGQAPLAVGSQVLLHDGFTIGRSQANSLTINDDWVSARHLILRTGEKGWTLEDVGSTNGTSVNGHPVHGIVRLRPADTIELGRIRLRLTGGL